MAHPNLIFKGRAAINDDLAPPTLPQAASSSTLAVAPLYGAPAPAPAAPLHPEPAASMPPPVPLMGQLEQGSLS